MRPQIKISELRRLIEIQSEPYVIFGRMGYQPAIDVIDVHSGALGYLIISATSLSEPLRELETLNSGKLMGLCISIQKENSSRMARYLVEKSE
jgi:hypothetical protein